MATPLWGFSGSLKPNDETNNSNEHNMVNNPNWQEADQFISKHDWGAERGSTEKQLQLSTSGEHEPIMPFAFQIWHSNYSARPLPAWLTCVIF